MNALIRTLKADIVADLQTIAELYAALHTYPEAPANPEQAIVVAYYLHNLYCTFESIFQRVAEVFENQVTDRPSWHAGLLHCMTLDVEDIRPHLVGPVAFDCLDELRRFRHLFRSAYRLHLDPERLALVQRKARALETVYRADMDRFLAFLDSLCRLED
jgi:hypothetical protein